MLPDVEIPAANCPELRLDGECVHSQRARLRATASGGASAGGFRLERQKWTAECGGIRINSYFSPVLAEPQLFTLRSKKDSTMVACDC